MNYSHASIDPERVREFAQRLDQLASHVEELNETMTGALVRLGHSWRDEQNEEFCEFFTKSQQILREFIDETRRRTPELRTDADIIRQAQSVKINL